MRVLLAQAVVRLWCVAVQRRSRLDVLLHFVLLNLLGPLRYNLSPHLAATLKDAHDHGFIFPASASDATLARPPFPRLTSDQHTPRLFLCRSGQRAESASAWGIRGKMNAI